MKYVIIVVATLALVISSGAFDGIYSDGIIKPKNPFLILGQPIKLNCTLTNYAGPEGSKSLYFVHREARVPLTFIHRKSTRTIQLFIQRSTIENDGKYSCVLKQKNGNVKLIGEQTVTVDYELKAPKQVKCRVYNWEKMICRWEIITPYYHPKNVNISLVWAVGGMKHSACPQQEKESCTWNWLNGHSGSFFKDKTYYMAFIVSNIRAGKSVTSTNFRIKPHHLVQPSKVSEVKATNINATCVSLRWQQNSLNARDAVKLYRLTFESPKTSNIQIDETTLTHSTKCNLRPFTLYKVTIACKPKIKGFWSENVTFNIRTKEDVPSYSPKLLAGNYAVISQDRNTWKIALFWKPIDEASMNGRLLSYRISYTDLASSLTDHVTIEDTSATHGTVEFKRSSTYRVSVSAWTKIGPSKSPTFIQFPSEHERPLHPEEFVVRVSLTSTLSAITLSWRRSSYGGSLKQYTIYWCVGSLQLKVCLSDIHWTSVLPNLTSYSLQLPASKYSRFIYGISADTSSLSSGILWSPCIYKKDKVPEVSPRNFHVDKMRKTNSLSLRWSKYACDDSGYVEHYLLYYCHVQGANCSAEIRSQKIPGAMDSYVISDLQSDVTYAVWLVPVTDGGNGPRSPVVYHTVLASNAGAAGLTVVHMVVIVIVGVILLLIVLLTFICCSRRKYQRRKSEQEKVLELTELPPLPDVKFQANGKYDTLPPSPTSRTPFLHDRELLPLSAFEASSTLPLNDLSVDGERPRAGGRIVRNLNHNGYFTTDSNESYGSAASGFSRTNGSMNEGDRRRLISPASGHPDNCIDLRDTERSRINEDGEIRRSSQDSPRKISHSDSQESCPRSKSSSKPTTPRLRDFSNRPLPKLPNPPPPAEPVTPYSTTDIIDTINRSCSEDELDHKYYIIESRDECQNEVDDSNAPLDLSNYVIDPSHKVKTLPTSSSCNAVGSHAKMDDDLDSRKVHSLRSARSFHNDRSTLTPVDNTDFGLVSEYMFNLPHQYYADPEVHDDLPSTEL